MGRMNNALGGIYSFVKQKEEILPNLHGLALTFHSWDIPLRTDKYRITLIH